MGHKIVKAIIENGQLKHVDKKLPQGRIRVHIIYDTNGGTPAEHEIIRVVKETSGIYKDIDEKTESKKLRLSIPLNNRQTDCL